MQGEARLEPEAQTVHAPGVVLASPIVAAVVGVAGPRLAASEAEQLREFPPVGVILFGRNIRDADQLAALVGELRGVLPEQSVLMVDQEGGRVARLRPPYFSAHPPCAALATARAAWLQGALIGAEAAAAGFDVVCAPVLDVRHEGASDAIGDRAFSGDPAEVARLAAAMARGLLAAGVQPVGKHAPGHGRAAADSHWSLPHVDGLHEGDLRPFAQNADLPWWMTAHVVYDGIDEQPATCSQRVISEVIRGRLGFAGLLISDDLAMQALSGSPAARARAAWYAGCDVALYCPGDAAGNHAVLKAAPRMDASAMTRLLAARARAAAARQVLDVPALAAERDALLAVSAA